MREGTKNGRFRHGKADTRIYYIWADMVARCARPTHKRYASYGGRGITVCERWLLFDNFYADMGERPDGRSLDRRNNDAGYSPENCRWATLQEQRANRRPVQRRPTCQARHEYTDKTTRWTKTGKRCCRICVNRWAAESRKRRRVAA